MIRRDEKAQTILMSHLNAALVSLIALPRVYLSLSVVGLPCLCLPLRHFRFSAVVYVLRLGSLHGVLLAV